MFQIVYDILLTLKYSYQANLSDDARFKHSTNITDYAF